MSDGSTLPLPVPPDESACEVAIVDPADPELREVAVVRDTYTILLSGDQTAGKYHLIDINVPHCGGPVPHRHDVDEMFSILEGQIEFTIRSEKILVEAGMTVNVPANAPHYFTQPGQGRARMLCLCAPVR